jgi:hypothetical protein
LLWIITLNAATLSRDLAQRTVPIQLKRPERNPNWEGETWKLIADQRWEIIADIIDELQRDAPPLSKFSRWAPWEKAVLARVPNPSEAQRVIAERQATIDDDAAEESLVRCAFLDILRERGHEPDEQIVWFSAAQAAEVINKAIGDRMPTNKASKFLGKLSIREVRKSDLGESRGWCWSGKNAPADTHMAKLMEPMPTFG